MSAVHSTAMSQAPDSAGPAPMEGHGHYNRSSRVQAAGSVPAVPLLVRAAQSVALPPAPLPVVIADYGASEGHNSLAPLAAAIAALRARIGTARAISVMHTDLPDNNFSVLFHTLARDPESYLLKDSAIFPAAIGRSFYAQILPDASVTLGWSSWAVQWLSRIPGAIPDQVQAAFSRDAAARAAFTQQAAADWRAFLAARARELHPGGRLVVLTMALDAAGDFGYRPLLDALYAALCAMVDERFLHADELARMVIPTVGRGRADLLAPFDAAGQFAGLSVEDVAVFSGEDRIWAAFARDGDAPAFGQRWAAFVRASVFPSLAAALAGGHEDARAAAFFDRLEAAVAARIAIAPQRTDIPLGRMLLAKAA